MKTSLTETANIEQYLQGSLSAGDAVLFEAKIVLQEELRSNTYWQEQTYQIIQMYGRQKLRAEIDAAQKLFFNDPAQNSLRAKIARLFSKK